MRPPASAHPSNCNPPANVNNRQEEPTPFRQATEQAPAGDPQSLPRACTSVLNNLMYSNLEQRFRDVVGDIHDTLIGISLDPRLMPNSAGYLDVAQRHVHSGASTPSLRSRDGTVPPHARVDGGGNVRVVVRVRAFLPRGTFVALSLRLCVLLCAALSLLLENWNLANCDG